MSRLSRRKFVAVAGGTAAAIAVGSKVIEASAATNAAAAPDAYAQQFLDLYAKIKNSANGYFHSSGVPYHSVETLMVEAPDHGHQTTSEAFSYWMWLEATYGRVTGDWAPFNATWAAAEKYIIPTNTDQPSNGSYNSSSPATYAPEWPLPSNYPSALDSSVKAGADPIAAELQSAYGTADIYGMHWLLDVDNVYGYGNTAGTGAENGPSAPGPCYINTYQRGAQESVWETIPQPCTDLMKYGGTNGYLDLFVKDQSYAKQYKYTNAPDADARAVQAAYWAYRWASAQGNAGAVSASVAKAAKMGDYLRYGMFDKYFKQVGGCTSPSGCAPGSGKNSAHYLLGWYYAWGGAVAGGGWAWRIGDGAAHHGYQNPVAAWALSTVTAMAPKSATGRSDWATSLTRQIEFLRWLQSADGGIAGGATNSWDGQYGQPPAGTPTFYGMAYDWEPVYHDPPSNNWFGMQAWGMERWAEYYYLTKDSRVKAVLDKWVTWVSGKVTVGTNGTFSIPSTLSWSGQPDTWNASSPGANANLRVSVTESGMDVGVTAALIKTLLYYASAANNTAAQTLGKNLLDALAVHTDSKGIGIAETRTDYSRFKDPVYVPSGWTGKMPNGDTINSSSTFLSIRSFYQRDPDWSKVQAYLNGGAAPSFTYHRFWAQADVAMALALYSELFLGGTTTSPSPSKSVSASASASASASVSASASASRSTSPSPSGGGGTGVTATYKIESDWGAGFVASITVKNNGTTPISSWRVAWTWAGNQQIGSSWNAGVTSSGRNVTATNLNYNGTIPPGGSTSFGFQGTYSGTNAAPTLSASGS
ncbi:glycoside hydrolase family 48 protein [Dactylosporangium sp. NPDC051541]|uniref:glycoside hydrolase family 48 protein n=1 Tax=Dactylosporangium sp. NPDC051541 TaxID=3363977 RepID=UPI00379F8AC0